MTENKRFAILIDADNISDKYVKTIFDEIIKEGEATIRRMYGDWTKENKKGWKKVALEYSITPIQQFENTQGKNSTDSAMIIDAMDILYSDRVDGFCICSSDSDFTRLAARLRESGKQVIGMGEKAKETTAMVSACQTYKYLDLIIKSEETPTKGNKTLSEAEKELKKEIIEIIESIEPEDSALSSYIGLSLKNKHSDFDSRNYGCKKLLDLLKKLGFKTEKVAEGKIKVYSK
jgi:uncharacterized LabA/DUF88 family protein